MLSETQPSTIHTDVACTVCGCVCDDLTVTVVQDRLQQVDVNCPLAQTWFQGLIEMDRQPPQAACIDGQAGSFEQAVDQAAAILSAARAPLIWGLARSSTAGQRVAVHIAEQLGATIDPAGSFSHRAATMAFQRVGASTCSLGEVRNRADLVVFWRSNPVETHPRHLERYSLNPVGLFTPRGRKVRTLIVIDSKPTATSDLADLFIQLPVEQDFETIWALRQILAAQTQNVPKHSPASISNELAVSSAHLEQLVDLMCGCRYGVLFHSLGQPEVGHASIEALLRLVKDLNAFTRFSARGLGGALNSTGAESVLCWQTGFPTSVNFARGYPRSNPGEYSANELLERGEVDACLLVGSESFSHLSAAAQRAMRSLPTVLLDAPHISAPFVSTVRFTTSVYGISAAGTATRHDDVTIPLRQLVPSSYPTDAEVLKAIRERLLSNAADHPDRQKA